MHPPEPPPAPGPDRPAGYRIHALEELVCTARRLNLTATRKQLSALVVTADQHTSGLLLDAAAASARASGLAVDRHHLGALLAAAAPHLAPSAPAQPPPAPERPTSRRTTSTPRHGEYAGYRWHINHGETPCEPCAAASRQYGADRRAGTRHRPEPRIHPCGTEWAYRRHLHRKETTDPACRAAHQLYKAQHTRTPQQHDDKGGEP
jgi:hypothetical protein